MDFAGWKQQVKDYLHKKAITDPTVDYFIEKAVSKIDGRFRGIENMKTVDVVDNAIEPIALPVDYLEMASFIINGQAMGQISPVVVEHGKRWNDKCSSVYFIRDALIVTPRTVMGADYTFDYFYRMPAMVNDTDDTPIMQVYPDLYLYAATFEACIFLEDWENAQSYKGLFDEMIESARRSAWRYRWGNTVGMRSI